MADTLLMITAGGRRYAVNGREVSAAEARARLAPAGAAVPDDATRPRLTVIGPEAQRRAERDDLARHPALAPWRDRLAVQDYAPDHWAVARAGFRPLDPLTTLHLFESLPPLPVPQLR